MALQGLPHSNLHQFILWKVAPSWNIVRFWKSYVYSNKLDVQEKTSVSHSSTESEIIFLRSPNTNSKPITTEKVFKNWVKRSIRKRRNLPCSSRRRTTSTGSSTSSWTVIEAKMGSSWSSWEKPHWIGRIKSDFKAQHSTQFRGENWSKIEILPLRQ